MREERKIFCIKIMDREALLVPYALGRTVAFLIFREPIGYLLWVIFCDFFFFLTFSQYVGKGRFVSHSSLALSIVDVTS